MKLHMKLHVVQKKETGPRLNRKCEPRMDAKEKPRIDANFRKPGEPLSAIRVHFAVFLRVHSWSPFAV
jgi:hypothetical protein